MNQERKFSCPNTKQSQVDHWQEKTAEIIGQTIGTSLIDYLRRRTRNFDLELEGGQNLDYLQDTPFILVANHIKTKGLVIGERDLNITPDAFILERSIEDLAGRRPQIVASSDFGFIWHKNPAATQIQKKVESWRDSVLTGANFIPIKRGEGKVNLKFFRATKNALSQNTPIIIFPEGNSYWDHEQETPLKDGVAILAKRNKVPILPARIEGATSWSPKSPISITFKEPVSPDQSIEEIMHLVRSGISTR